ncbi:hypothetical protein I4U23_026072 [Adineta vaga]|nr:hypothetical protein I4U23_026072 [Adineta vaga]
MLFWIYFSLINSISIYLALQDSDSLANSCFNFNIEGSNQPISCDEASMRFRDPNGVEFLLQCIQCNLYNINILIKINCSTYYHCASFTFRNIPIFEQFLLAHSHKIPSLFPAIPILSRQVILRFRIRRYNITRITSDFIKTIFDINRPDLTIYVYLFSREPKHISPLEVEHNYISFKFHQLIIAIKCDNTYDFTHYVYVDGVFQDIPNRDQCSIDETTQYRIIPTDSTITTTTTLTSSIVIESIVTSIPLEMTTGTTPILEYITESTSTIRTRSDTTESTTKSTTKRITTRTRAQGTRKSSVKITLRRTITRAKQTRSTSTTKPSIAITSTAFVMSTGISNLITKMSSTKFDTTVIESLTNDEIISPILTTKKMEPVTTIETTDRQTHSTILVTSTFQLTTIPFLITQNMELFTTMDTTEQPFYRTTDILTSQMSTMKLKSSQIPWEITTKTRKISSNTTSKLTSMSVKRGNEPSQTSRNRIFYLTFGIPVGILCIPLIICLISSLCCRRKEQYQINDDFSLPSATISTNTHNNILDQSSLNTPSTTYTSSSLISIQHDQSELSQKSKTNYDFMFKDKDF